MNGFRQLSLGTGMNPPTEPPEGGAGRLPGALPYGLTPDRPTAQFTLRAWRVAEAVLHPAFYQEDTGPIMARMEDRVVWMCAFPYLADLFQLRGVDAHEPPDEVRWVPIVACREDGTIVCDVEQLEQVVRRLNEAFVGVGLTMEQVAHAITAVGHAVGRQIEVMGDLARETCDRPLVGIRAWRLYDRELQLEPGRRRGMALTSCFAQCYWAGPVVRLQGHINPLVGKARNSGFYSYKPEAVAQDGSRFEELARYPVIGVVSHFGTVVVCEHGYRSSVVRVDRLFLGTEAGRNWEATREALAECYQCPVEYLGLCVDPAGIDEMNRDRCRAMILGAATEEKEGKT